MSFELQALAKKKHLETRLPETEWLKALESAQQSLQFMELKPETLERFALASGAPSKFTNLVRMIYQHGKSHPHGALISDLVLRYANESHFSLPDWIDAIDFFSRWLESNERKTDFLSMLEYLHCCVDAPDARQPGQTLLILVEDMLEVMGYEGL
jgi:hypothetical protein